MRSHSNEKNKIAVIAHNCRAGGGLIIVRQLLEHLIALGNSEEFFVVYSQGYGYEEIVRKWNCQSYCYQEAQSPLRRWYFEKFVLKKIIHQAAPDVILGAGNIGIVNPPCPQSLLIHSAYLYHGRDRFPGIGIAERMRIWMLRRQVKASLDQSQRVFVQTPVVQKRFSERWNYPAERIQILRFPAPVEIRPDPGAPLPDLFKDDPDSFRVLFLTRHMPHRNPDILLPLCRRYQERFRKEKIRFITTLGQNERKQAGRFLRQVQREGLNDLILNAGRLNRQQVVQYFMHCQVFWLHTLMETLCLPFMEAMTMGAPILAPDFDFSRYVCGTAAQYYDPWKVDSVFENLMRICEDTALRQSMIKRGRCEMGDPGRFSGSWEEISGVLLEELRKLARQAK